MIYDIVQQTVYSMGSFVLMSYLVRPPSKLSARWAGPYRIVTRKANSAELEDLTGGPSKTEVTVDESRLKPFIVAPGVDVQAVAASDLGKRRWMPSWPIREACSSVPPWSSKCSGPMEMSLGSHGSVSRSLPRWRSMLPVSPCSRP
jgi:hypothetical protein